MPTLGTPERGPLLRRALQSVLTQARVETVPIVVFNGPRRDLALVREVKGDARVRTLEFERADLPAALLAGRRLVSEPWFAELDDDDELLPGALERRVRELESRPERGAVVTNGVRRGDARDTVHITDIDAVAADPVRALLTQNWLLPGSWLCRTDAVPGSVFEGIPRYLECTYLAIRLASVTGLTFIDEPTVVYHEDTPCSESKSPQYVLGQEAALRRIMELELPPEVRRWFKGQLGRACWAAAMVLAERGDVRGAGRQGLRALTYPGGWRRLPRLLPVTRRLLRTKRAEA